MTRTPRLAPGCNLKLLPLTPADAFLLSRVDGTANENELAAVTGFALEQVATMLDRLGALGALEETEPVSPRRTGPRLVQPAGGEDLQAMRRQVLARKLSGTHAATPTPAFRPEADPARARRTAEALEAQQLRAAAEARDAQLAGSLERGKAALERRDFTAALNAYKMAASLAPEDREVQATCNDAIRRAAGALADGYWEQAVLAEGEQRWEEAALAYYKVCAGRPTDALAHERVANAALKAGNVRRAVEFARKALELAPRTALFHVTLARAYAAAGLEASAQGELDRALALAPTDARIQNLVSRVRSLALKASRAG